MAISRLCGGRFACVRSVYQMVKEKGFTVVAGVTFAVGVFLAIMALLMILCGHSRRWFLNFFMFTFGAFTLAEVGAAIAFLVPSSQEKIVGLINDDVRTTGRAGCASARDDRRVVRERDWEGAEPRGGSSRTRVGRARGSRGAAVASASSPTVARRLLPRPSCFVAQSVKTLVQDHLEQSGWVLIVASGVQVVTFVLAWMRSSQLQKGFEEDLDEDGEYGAIELGARTPPSGGEWFGSMPESRWRSGLTRARGPPPGCLECAEKDKSGKNPLLKDSGSATTASDDLESGRPPTAKERYREKTVRWMQRVGGGATRSALCLEGPVPGVSRVVVAQADIRDKYKIRR